MRNTTPAVSFRTQGESTAATHPATLAYDRDFLQTRLALFARTLALFALAFYVIASTVSVLGHAGSAGVPGDIQLFPLFSATYALVWWLCRKREHRSSFAVCKGGETTKKRGRTHDRRVLDCPEHDQGPRVKSQTREKPLFPAGHDPPRTANIAKVELSISKLHAIDASALVVAGILFACSGYLVRDNLVEVSRHATVAFTVIARAALVPATAFRSAVLSVMAFVPLFIVAFFVWDNPAASWPESVERPSYTLFVAHGLFWAALATVVTQVIHGLRRAVQKAQRLGQYELIEKIGEGGMGQVFRARHAMLQRPTAVKLLLRGLDSPQDVARFEREVQLTCRLTHPNTISIFDYGRTPEGVFYYAMEFLEGIDLERLVHSDGAQCPARVVHILKQVCESLAEAHERGMVHRDIKPANIILCREGWRYDAVKVVDFGLVKDTRLPSNQLSVDGEIHGTPHYMSPECYSDDEGTVDSRSDLYALGCVGYYLLTGRTVFEASGILEVVGKHRREIPRRPSEIAQSIPEDLEVVLLTCLEKDPDRRPSSARNLLGALDGCSAVPAWSEEEASAWWRDRDPAPATSSISEDDDLSDAETVVVKRS